MRGEGPGGGGRREIVHRRAGLRVGVGERDDEIAALALVANEARRVEIRRRDGRRFRLAREANRRGALRQGDEALAHDDALDVREALLVQIEDALGRRHVPLERSQHVAVVRRWQLALARDVGREPHHRLAHLGKGGRAERNGLLRTDIDADVLQAIGVELRRQPGRGARSGEDALSHPVAIGAHLRRKALVRRLPVGCGARPKELADAGDIALAVIEMLLDRATIGPEQTGTGALFGALACELGERPRRCRHAGIALQPLGGMRVARLGIALVEQSLQPFVHLARHIAVGHEQAVLERGGAPHARERVENDVEILAHARVLLLQASGAQARSDRRERGIGALDEARLEVAHFAVVALETDLRHPLRMEATERLERHMTVAVATFDPRPILARRSAARDDQQQSDGGSHSGFSRMVTCDSMGP